MLHRVTAVYPNHAGSRFDVAYYAGRHTELARRLLAPHLRDLRTNRGIAALDGAPPPFWMVAEMLFDSEAAFADAFAAAGEALFADAANYTDVTPILFASEIAAEPTP